jgi:alpha-maltose-1-phosphate synthase
VGGDQWQRNLDAIGREAKERGGATRPGKMEIAVSGVTGTHPLYLAEQLALRSRLQAYYTTLPHRLSSRVPASKTKRNPPLLAAMYAISRGWVPGNQLRNYRRVAYAFDRWIAHNLGPAAATQSLAGSGLVLRREAKRRYGSLSICDSGTSHERWQHRLLAEEARIWRLEDPPQDPRHLDRVQQEYDEADLIVVPSSFAARSFVESGVSEAKLAIVPYGADLSEYSPVKKHDSTFRILFVGTVTARKGVQYLFEALSGLSLPGAELLIRGGRAHDTDSLSRLYKSTVPIRQVPAQPRNMMRDLYSSASVLVLPSVEDGFGLVIPQAMACGVPVIATRNTGGPEIIIHKQNGLLVEARDAPQLRDAILELYENPVLLKEMGRQARSTIESMGGWRSYGEGFVTAVRRATDSRSQPRL